MGNEDIMVVTIPPPTVKMPKITKYSRVATEIKVGRGYSIGEIKEAGLTPYIAKQFNIPIDTKRRSIHRNNVENLRKVIEQISELIRAKKTKPAKLITKQSTTESISSSQS